MGGFIESRSGVGGCQRQRIKEESEGLKLSNRGAKTKDQQIGRSE